MTTSLEVRTAVKEALGAAGFDRRGPAWVRTSDELMWIVQIDRSPRKESYSLDFGLMLLRAELGGVPTRANDCPIVMHLENLPLDGPEESQGTRFAGFRSTVVACMDFTFELPNEYRRSLIRSVLKAAAEYVATIETENDLRKSYEAGELRSAFIRKDAKQILAQVDARDE